MNCFSQFTGPNCDQCFNPKMNPLQGCTQCLPQYTGASCDQCANSRMDINQGCTQCQSQFINTGSCELCTNPHMDPNQSCATCLSMFYNDGLCNACINGKDPATNCQDCPATNCGTRATLNHSTCQCECSSPYTGTAPGCNQCLNGKEAASGCTDCTPFDCGTKATQDPNNCGTCICLSPFLGTAPACNAACSNVYTPESDCTECPLGYMGDNCDQCTNPRKNPAQNCAVCLPQYVNDGECTACVNGKSIATDCATCDNVSCNPRGQQNSNNCQCECNNNPFVGTYPNCDTSCTNNHTPASGCTSCPAGFGGASCGECLNVRMDPSSGCTTCLPLFINNASCDTCANQYHDINVGCSDCVAGRTGYPDCQTVNPCSNPLHQPPACTDCIPGRINYPTCDYAPCSGNPFMLPPQCTECNTIELNANCQGQNDLPHTTTCTCAQCPIKSTCIASGGTPQYNPVSATCQCNCPQGKEWDNGSNQCKTIVTEPTNDCSHKPHTQWDLSTSQCIPTPPPEGCDLDCQNKSWPIPWVGKEIENIPPCLCVCQDKWVGLTCNLCQAECLGPGSRASLTTCTCRCGKNLSGANCSCVMTPFLLTFNSLPPRLLNLFTTNPELAASDTTLIKEISTQMGELVKEFTRGDNVIHINDITFNPSGTKSTGASLTIDAAWSDGCARNAGVYDEQLEAWKRMLDAWKLTPPTIILDGETVNVDDITDLSPEGVMPCEYFDSNIPGRCNINGSGQISSVLSIWVSSSTPSNQITGSTFM